MNKNNTCVYNPNDSDNKSNNGELLNNTNTITTTNTTTTTTTSSDNNNCKRMIFVVYKSISTIKKVIFNLNQKIESLKKVEAVLNLSDQDYFYSEHILSQSNTFAFYNIENDSILYAMNKVTTGDDIYKMMKFAMKFNRFDKCIQNAKDEGFIREYMRIKDLKVTRFSSSSKRRAYLHVKLNATKKPTMSNNQPFNSKINLNYDSLQEPADFELPVCF